MARFDGRNAIVTGAGGGIGAATARRFASEGAAVMCLDVDIDAARRTVDTVREAGGCAAVLHADVRDEESCRAAVAGALDAFGAVHVLANVAGVGGFRATNELSLEEWNRTLAVNLTGTFLMSRHALEPLLATKGAIVNMASVAGLRATPYNAAYCASKGGVVMLTKALAVEFGGAGLRVNCVCPSSVDTAFLRHFRIPDGADLSLFARTGSVLARKSTPDEIATAVAYLASDDAAMVTGTALVIDGGATA